MSHCIKACLCDCVAVSVVGCLLFILYWSQLIDDRTEATIKYCAYNIVDTCAKMIRDFNCEHALMSLIKISVTILTK